MHSERPVADGPGPSFEAALKKSSVGSPDSTFQPGAGHYYETSEIRSRASSPTEPAGSRRSSDWTSSAPVSRSVRRIWTAGCGTCRTTMHGNTHTLMPMVIGPQGAEGDKHGSNRKAADDAAMNASALGTNMAACCGNLPIGSEHGRQECGCMRRRRRSHLKCSAVCPT